MFKPQQVFPPLAVNGLQQQLFFDVAHGFGTEGFQFGGHQLVAFRHQTFAHHFLINALFGGPFQHRQVHAQLFDHSGIKPRRVPLIGIGFRRQEVVNQILDHLMAHVLDDLAKVFGLHDLQPLPENGLALIIHHVVEFQQLLADVEVAAFDLGLRPFKAFVDPGVNDGFALFQTQLGQDGIEPFRPENPHQIVFEAQEEFRPPRIALPTGTAAQLIVDAAGLMAFGAQHEQTTGGQNGDLFLGMFSLDPGAHFIGVQVGVGGNRLQHQHFDVTAELNVSAATSHVGGDGHRIQLARIGHDLGLLLVLPRVQHVVNDPCGFQQSRQEFRLFNRGGADQNRLALLVRLLDRLHHAFIFLARCAENLIVLVLAVYRAVGGHCHHAQLVNLHEFIRFGRRRAGHPGQLSIKAEVVLKRHRSQRHVFRLDRHAFLGFDRLMQPFGQPTAPHHPSGEFVNQHHLAIADDVLLILVEQLVRPQRLRDVVNKRRAFGIVKRLLIRQQTRGVQPLFQIVVALVGVGDVAGLFVQLEMCFGQVGDQQIDLLIKVAAVLRRARDDQRRARLIDQNRVDLVHDGKGMPALRHFLDAALHVVAQVIKAQLVIGRIGDVGAVSGLFLGIGLIGIDHAGGQAQRRVDLAHPDRIALGQIIVDGDDMHALARQGVQIGGKGRHQRLALAGFHFGDVALMQEDPALQLHIEGAQTQGAPGGLAAVGERLGQHVIQTFAAFLHPALKLCRPGLDAVIAQRGKLRLQRVDLCDQRAHRFDHAIIRRTKDLPSKCSKTQHVFSAWPNSACRATLT